MTRNTTFSTAFAAGVALAAGVLLGGCSINSDDAPRALAIATTTTEAPTAATSGGSAAVLYYIREGKLVPVTRSLPDRGVEVVLNALLKMPDPNEAPAGVGTSLPTGTTLHGVDPPRGGSVEVDLSKEFENVVGPSRQQAIAQMVMTASEFPDVTSMRFSIDGKPLQVPTRTRGDSTSVDDCDFADMLLPADQAVASELPASTIERLNLKRNELAATCSATTQTTR